MSNWVEHLDELASVEADVKKKVAFQSSARLIKELAKGGAELRAELLLVKGLLSSHEKLAVAGIYYTEEELDRSKEIWVRLATHKLREELAALKAGNAKLNSVVCQTCHGAGSVCSAPDDCYNCPACTAIYNKIRADAIRDMLTCIGGAIENDFISMREIEEMTLDDFFTLAKKHANKIEDGS